MKKLIGFVIGAILLFSVSAYALEFGTVCINGLLFAYAINSSGYSVSLVQIYYPERGNFPPQPITCKK